jgi:hypothetical protein
MPANPSLWASAGDGSAAAYASAYAEGVGVERVRARLEALVRANAAPRCGARSKRTGKPCPAAAMPNRRCKVHGGKSTGPRTPEGIERSRRANWKHGYYSREAKAERSRVRAAMCSAIWAARSKGPTVPRSDKDHTGPSISPDRLASMPMARSPRALARRRFRVLSCLAEAIHIGQGVAMQYQLPRLTLERK